MSTSEGQLEEGEDEIESLENRKALSAKKIAPHVKKTVGLVERVTVKGMYGEKEVLALFDTGATRSSVDYNLAGELGLGPVVGSVKVKSKSDKKGYLVRPLVLAEL